MTMKKEEIARGISMNNNNNKANSSSSVGNKVLPVSETALKSSLMEKKDNKLKTDKSKALFRLKELLRWAAATAKSEKGAKFIGKKVIQIRNRAAIKTISNDQDQESNESPKMSFRWEVERFSTSSYADSGLSMTSSTRNHPTVNMLSMNSKMPDHYKKGNWITTDSEFVVLEL